MTAKIRNRDMWKAIPWKRRAEIAKQIKRMPECRNKEILRLAFIENLSTADTAEEQNMICLCKDCHRTVTEYHRKLYPEHFKSESASKF